MMEFLVEYGWIIVLIILAVVMYVVRFKMVGEKQATIELRVNGLPSYAHG